MLCVRSRKILSVGERRSDENATYELADPFRSSGLELVPAASTRGWSGQETAGLQECAGEERSPEANPCRGFLARAPARRPAGGTGNLGDESIRNELPHRPDSRRRLLRSPGRSSRSQQAAAEGGEQDR